MTRASDSAQRRSPVFEAFYQQFAQAHHALRLGTDLPPEPDIELARQNPTHYSAALMGRQLALAVFAEGLVHSIRVDVTLHDKTPEP